MLTKPKAQPAERVDNWPLAKIVPYENNPRAHGDAQVDLLAQLMQRYGIDQPIVVDEKGVILKGHGRRLAAIKAGFHHFPVVVHRGLSESDKRALRIADNQVTLLGTWDADLIRIELEQLKLDDYDLPMLGFSSAELTQFFQEPTPDAADELPPPPAKPICQKGELWQLGDHRLLCGNATKEADVAKLLGTRQPPLMVTDPPYGVDYDPDWRNRAERANGKPYGGRAIAKPTNDDRTDWTQAWKLFRGDIAYCWHADRHASAVQASLEAAQFEIVCQLIWAKDRFVISRGDYHWQHEPCWYAVRKGKKHVWSGDRSQTTLWQIPHLKSDTGHSTQKPVECMRRPIVNNSDYGALVYDPFVGSGTTIIAAEMTGRACLAIEIEPSYCDIVIKRWERFTGKKAKRAKS